MKPCDATGCDKPAVSEIDPVLTADIKSSYCYTHGAMAEELGLFLIWND